MNGRLMNLIQKEIQSNPQLLAAMQRPEVLGKLSIIAENIFKLNDETTMAEYQDDEDLKPFIEALQPIVKQFQDDEEIEFESKIKELKESYDYKTDEQYKRMELLISGYIRSEFDGFVNSKFQKYTLHFMVEICAKMSYVSYIKLKSLTGDIFIKKQKEENSDEIKMIEATFENDIIGNEFILFYFSGCWCPPSKQFTPKLAEFHKNAISDGHKIQIIFISSDRGEKTMEKYYKEYHGEYIAVPFTERERQKKLSEHFENEYIPAVYVTNDQAQIIDNDARWTVTNHQENNVNAIQKWKMRNEKLKQTI